MKRFLLLPVCLVLAACGSATDELGPGGVSVEDARALDEAAAKLDDEATDDGTTKAKTR